MYFWISVFAIFITIYYIYDYRRIKKAENIVFNHLTNNNWSIIKIKFKHQLPMALSFKGSKLHVWFYVELKDANGIKYFANVRVGDWITGLFHPDVKIFWIGNEGKIFKDKTDY